jgi:LysR family hydrogen peroxide-inducible transcriptional activator
LFLALPDDHPLAREEKVAASKIEPSDVLSLSDGHCLRDQVPERCQPRSMAGGERGEAAGLLECEQLSTLQALVAAGLGVAFVPEMSVPGGPRPGIVYRRLEKPVTRRQIALLKRRGRKMSPAARALAECLRELPKRVERRHASGELRFEI